MSEQTCEYALIWKEYLGRRDHLKLRMKVVVLNPVPGALIRGKFPYTKIQKENVI